MDALIKKILGSYWWPYFGLTYLVGYGFGASSKQDFLNWQFWFGLLFFLVAANVFVFSAQTLFDHGAAFLYQKEHKSLEWSLLIGSLLVSGPFALFLNQKAMILFILFCFLAFFYYAPPLRLKSHPFFDTSATIFYALPGFLAYTQLTNHWPPFMIVGAVFAWFFATKLFSSIPQISMDTQNGQLTTATYLGQRGSLLTASGMWVLAVMGVIDGNGLFNIGLVFPLIPVYCLIKNSAPIELLSRLVHFLALLCAAVLFWYAIRPF